MITVVMGVRDRRAQLFQCLRSLKDQVEKDLEVIVVDYGGTDGIKKMVEGFGFTYVFTHASIFSRTKALNIGIKRAKGDYILCTDADMVFASNFIQAAKAAANKTALVMCLCRRYNGPIGEGIDFETMLGESYEGHPDSIGACQMLHREVWFKIRGFDEDFVAWGCEDHDIRERTRLLKLREVYIQDKTRFVHMDHEVDDKCAYRNDYLWGWHSRLMKKKAAAGSIVRNENRTWGKVYDKPRKVILNLIATSLVGGVEWIYKGLIEHVDRDKYEMWTIVTTMNGPLEDGYRASSDYFCSITAVPPKDHFELNQDGEGRVAMIKQLTDGIPIAAVHIWNSESGYAFGRQFEGRVVNGMYGEYTADWPFFVKRIKYIRTHMVGKNYLVVCDNMKNAQLFPGIEFKFVHTGIEDPDDAEIPRGDKTCIWVGRASGEKRIEIFMALAELMPDYRFILVAPKSPGFQRVPVNMRFYFGITDRKTIYDLYKSASVFLNTSSVEGLPLSLLEAMKCGCYPICPDIGGISAKLADVGTLLPRDSQADAYARVIRSFTSLPDAEKEALRISVKKAVELHSFKQMVSEITEAWMC